MEPKPFKMVYRNYRGEVADRLVAPIEIWFGVSPFHEGEQWFLKAADLQRAGNPERDFALNDIVGPGMMDHFSKLMAGSVP